MEYSVIDNNMKPKECLHDFHSVYYGSEWAVECKKCGKDISSIYNTEDANYIVEQMLKENQK